MLKLGINAKFRALLLNQWPQNKDPLWNSRMRNIQFVGVVHEVVKEQNIEINLPWTILVSLYSPYLVFTRL